MANQKNKRIVQSVVIGLAAAALSRVVYMSFKNDGHRIMLVVMGALVLVMVAVAVLTFAMKRRSKTIQRELAETPVDTDGLKRSLTQVGLARVANGIMELITPCMHLELIPDESVPLGKTKIGGPPDLPVDSAWPQWQGKPMSFIAQINCEDFRGTPVASELPTAGLISFFYDAEQSTWGFDPKDEGSWRVLYHGVSDGLVRRELPDGYPGHEHFTQCSVIPVASISLPDTGSPAFDMELTDEEDDAYFELIPFILEHTSSTQLLGHARPIQSAMEEECQMVSGGLYLGDGNAYNDPRAKELTADAADWRLLLQVDSEEDAGMMWGDEGMLYFWIRKQDLADLRFDRVWMILQCF